MALYKLEEFFPNYQEELFDGDDIKGLDVYAGKTGEKIGTLDTALVDRQGCFRYLVIDTGFWIFGKKVLLPVGYCQIDEYARRIYAIGLISKKQVEDLPEYNDNTNINRNYEERVRQVYGNLSADAPVKSVTDVVVPIEASLPIEASAPLEPAHQVSLPGIISAKANNATPDYDTYDYQQEPYMYDLNDRDHQTLKLYAERLVANKKRRQTGEVVVAKHVETEKARVMLPLEKERVVIERTTPTADNTIPFPGNITFSEGEVARMKVYEETADIHKQAFVREEVKIRKEVERDTVEAEEILRREELDIDTTARRVVDRKIDRR